MESLPVEIYDGIFDHLHLIDLARLKQVCKKLHCFVQNYRVRELEISSGELSLDLFTRSDYGDYQNSCIIRPRNLKRTMPYRIYIRSSKNSLFDPRPFLRPSLDPTVELSAYDIFLRSPQFNVQFLKSLACVYSDSPCLFGFEDLNKLVQLERLEISFYNTLRPFEQTHGKLSLPNLKILLLEMNEDGNFTMEIEAPKCHGFSLKSGEDEDQHLQAHFRNPHSVKYLNLQAYHESSHVFKNIEFIQIAQHAHLIDERFFAAFPRLKTLKIIDHNSLEGLRQLFRLSRQGRRNVTVFFHGIQLVDGKELDAFEPSDFDEGGFRYGSNQDYLYRLMDNYDKLENGLNFLTRIEFSQRAARLLEADADRFLRIFNNFNHISTKIKIERPELFLRLLTSYDSLQYLWIVNSGMPQQYFDQLASIQTLLKLHIEEETKIDLSFTFKMPVLRTLVTNHYADLREETRLEERAGNLFTLCVQNDEIDLDISKLAWGEVPYVLVISKKFGSILTRPEKEELKSFEDSVRRYEEEMATMKETERGEGLP